MNFLLSEWIYDDVSELYFDLYMDFLIGFDCNVLFLDFLIGSDSDDIDSDVDSDVDVSNDISLLNTDLDDVESDDMESDDFDNV